MGKVYITEIQKRFSDVDLFGHVNNVYIQDYFDLGKTDFYTNVLGDTMNWHKDALVIVSVHSDYMEQTRYKDEVYVETAIAKIGNKSFTFLQKLIDREKGRVNAICRTVVVGFDFEKQVSMPLLPYWVEQIREYLVDEME